MTIHRDTLHAARTGHFGARRAGFQIDLRGDGMVAAAHAQPDRGKAALLLGNIHAVGARRVAAEFAAHHLHVAVDVVLGGAGVADLLGLECGDRHDLLRDGRALCLFDRIEHEHRNVPSRVRP